MTDKLDIDSKKNAKYKKLRSEIDSHNSKHYHYFNTLMLADLYKDQIFYLPTFLDFRGRIYTMTTYLSYLILWQLI